MYRRASILWPLLLATALSVVAQITTASLQGIVRDNSGAVIPGAQVRIVDTDTNVATAVTTGSNGRFLAASLQPGRYEVFVEAQGFKRLQRGGIVLNVNQALELDLSLAIGETTETVEVSARGTLLDSTTSEMGQIVDSRSILNLPLNQRNPWSLVFLTPGVAGSAGDTVYSVAISINGGRPGTTALMIDGIPSATPNVNSGNLVPTAFPSVDIIQEFKVETNNYSAEFGRSGSGIINLVYKSGSNTLHGSSYEFLRNSDLDANNFFSNKAGVGLPSFKRNQFGATLGGPVYIPKLYNGRNKTFFMFGYEGLRESTGTALTTSAPTLLQAQGDFSQTRNPAGAPIVIYDPMTTTPSGTGFIRSAFPGNVIPRSRFDPVAANVVKYYPPPNQPGNSNTGLNNYVAASTSPKNVYTVDGKVDENLNDRNRFFVRASRRSLTIISPDQVPEAVSIAQGGNTTVQNFTNAAADYTFTKSPTFLTDIRYGFARATWNIVPRSLGFDPVQLGFPAYMRNSAATMFSGFQVTNYFTLGNGFSSQWAREGFNTQSLAVRSMKVLTSHLIKFGFELQAPQSNVYAGASVDGGFTFTQAYTQGPNPNAASSLAGSALASLLLGAGTGTLTIPNQPKQTSKYYAWYIADDWKVTSRLTLNIGFRYGLDVPFIDRYNRFAIFNPNAISPLAASSGLPNLKGGLEFPGVNGYPRRVVSTNFSGWDPRFGFAYRAWKNTVLRGGFGIFHVPSLEQAQGNQNSTGFAGLSSFVSAANGILPTDFLSNPFQGGLVPATGSSQGLLTGVGTAVSGPALRGDNRLPYVEQWNFNVQQQLPGEIRVEAGYVGGHSVFLSFPAWNFNQLRPEQLSAALQQQVRNPFFGQITNGPLSTATVPLGSVVAPFPQYQSLTLAATSGAFSTYEAFQLKVEKRFGSGASFLLSYASQKLLDNNSATGIGPNAAIQNIYNVIAEKSVSAGSIAQSLSFSYTYELPFGTGKPIGKSWGRALNYALGGWQTNGIATFQTGVPLAVTAPNTSGSGSSVLRPNNNGNSAKLSGPTNRRLDQYFNTSVFSQPAPFTFGNTARTLSDVRAPGVKNFDLSVFKNFRPVERMTVQFRAEAFNSFNRVQFAAPNSVLNSGQFGVISAQANTPRQIQFGIKLLF